MITEIPSFDEFFGLDNENISSDEFTPTLDGEIDEQLMLVAILTYYLTLYEEYQYKTPEYILKNLPQSIETLKEKVEKTSVKELESIANTHKIGVLEKYGIHPKVMPKITLDYNINNTIEVIKSSVKATLNQLRDDIETKALVFKDAMIKSENFNIKSNFKRAIRKTKNYVRFNAQNIKQKVTRAIQKFVHGPGMEYFWTVAGRNTCSTCYAWARLPPQTIEMWPLDHPNGKCSLRPVSDKTTVEYKGYLEQSANLTII
jgi:DNA-directed RNA polymerase subunit H (RpoH/RPB5)